MTLAPTKPPSLTIDWDAYGELMEDSNLNDEQKRELIQTLWSLVVNFVDLGLGVHPVQQVEGRIVSLDEIGLDDVVDWHQDTNITQKTKNVLSPQADNEKGV